MLRVSTCKLIVNKLKLLSYQTTQERRLEKRGQVSKRPELCSNTKSALKGKCKDVCNLLGNASETWESLMDGQVSGQASVTQISWQTWGVHVCAVKLCQLFWMSENPRHKMSGEKKTKSTVQVRKHWHLFPVSKCHGRELFIGLWLKLTHFQNTDLKMNQKSCVSTPPLHRRGNRHPYSWSDVQTAKQLYTGISGAKARSMIASHSGTLSSRPAALKPTVDLKPTTEHTANLALAYNLNHV